MTSRHHGDRTLRPGLAARLDPVCDAFEAAWLANTRPALEDYLPRAQEADRPDLFAELLAIDLDYRARDGDQPEAGEYRNRLPEYATLIHDAFAARSTIHPRTRLASTPHIPGQRTAGPQPPPRWELPQQAGRYELEGEIARGGMGVVLRARDPDLNRTLALKVLRPGGHDLADLTRRFRAEAQITGQLQHPNIPPVYEVGALPDGQPFFAMKLIRGQTLAELLDERATALTDRPRFLGIFEQACQALAYAHSRDIIHRDLKPANIMVGAFGEVQVMDWGLAKVLDRPEERPSQNNSHDSVIETERTHAPELASQVGSIMGTPSYMAPEQARGDVDQLDKRCDVFGLGAILCAILTGDPPYTGSTSAEVRLQAMSGDLEGAFARLAECEAGPELISLTRACLAADPQHRPPDARALADAVTAYLSGVQEKLRQSELERVAALLRTAEERKRRRLAATLAAVSLVALAAVIIAVGSWRWVEQVRETHRVQTAATINSELDRAVSLRGQAIAIPLTDAAKRTESARLWNEALTAALKAETTLAAVSTDAAFQERSRETIATFKSEAADIARDRDMMEKLDKAQNRRGAIRDEDMERTNPRAIIVFGFAAAESYATAFREYGIDVLALEPTDAAVAIQARPRIRIPLAAALDDWLALEADHPVALRLLAISRVVDPDPFRNRLREAVASGDRAALLQLAEESALTDLPISAALLLADGLHLAGELEQAVTILRRAQVRHPDDFWVNDILGVYLASTDVSRVDEAAACFSAALALRPQTSFVLNNLGDVRTLQCRWQQASEAYAASYRSGEHYSRPQIGLVDLLLTRGEPEDIDRAITIAEEIRNQIPHFWLARLSLARARTAKALLCAARGDQKGAEREKAMGLTLAQECSNLKNGHALVHAIYAESLLLNERPDQAIAAANEAIKISPYITSAHLTKGYSYLAKSDTTNALACADEARKRLSNSPDVYLLLSAIYSQQGNTEEAIAAGRRAVSLRPEYWSHHVVLSNLLRGSRVDEALSEAREAVRLGPGNPQTWNALGNALVRKEMWAEAVTAHETAVRLDPQCALFSYNLSITLGKSGKLMAAFIPAQKAVALDPQSAEYQANVGYILAAQNNPALAVPFFQTAIGLHPGRAEYHNALGMALKNSKEVPRALQAFQKAAELDARVAQHWLNLADAYMLSKEYAGAAAALDEAIKRDGKNPASHAKLGRALRLMGSFENAIGPCRKALQINANIGWMHNELGLALHESGQLDEAIDAFRQGLRVSANDPYLLDNLGYALTRTGRLEEATTYFRKATEIPDAANKGFNTANAFWQLGTALLATGRFQEARRALEKGRTIRQGRKELFVEFDQEIARCDRLIALEPKKNEALAGQIEPGNSTERFDLALFCYYTGHPRQAVRDYVAAFAQKAATSQAQSHFVAIVAAAKAAAEAEGDEAARFRLQAFRWLQEDLTGLKKGLAGAPDEQRNARNELIRWQHHDALFGLRDPRALAHLPAAERQRWQALWAEVAALRKGDEPKEWPLPSADRVAPAPRPIPNR